MNKLKSSITVISVASKIITKTILNRIKGRAEVAIKFINLIREALQRKIIPFIWNNWKFIITNIIPYRFRQYK